MAVDFNALRARKGGNMAALQSNLEKTESKRTVDPRIWKPKRNDKGISSNIIRFLPIPFVDMEKVEQGLFNEDQLTPMAKIQKNAFQGPKGWFIENSLQTFGEDCPVREWSGPQWKPLKEMDEKDPAAIKEKTRLKKFIPRTDYYANILVIKDGTNPENNGKVMLYQFGEAQRKIIEKCDNPEFDTDIKFDPFDFWEGADLVLNLTYEIKKFDGKDNYVPKWDAVKFNPQSPACGGDEAQIEALWKQEHSLLDFYDRKNYKTYDELKAKFQKVMGLDENYNPAGAGSTLGSSAEEFLQSQTAPAQTAPAATPAAAPKAAELQSTTSAAPAASAPAAGGSSDLDEFEALLNS